MARQIKKLTPKTRLAKASKEALIEGAAGMSGKIVKKLAKDFLMGAMVKPKITETPRKKTSKKSLININKKPKTPGQYYTPGTIEGEFLQNNKKSTNKMKKESAFKMKGFSGFKNESPTKQKGKANATKETTYKNPKMKQDNYASRSDTVLASAKNYPGYYSLNKENKAKVQGAIDRLDGYVPSNKEAYRQFKGR